jgi:hypothetical protein
MIPLNSPEENLVEQKKGKIRDLLSTDVVGDYKVRFTLTDHGTGTGTLEIRKQEEVVIKGLFQVYIQDDEVYTTLFSEKKVKVLDKPSDDFLNILKFMLLAKT